MLRLLECSCLNNNIFLQTALLLVLALILINISTYATIFLTLSFIVLLALQLTAYGLAIFAIFIIIAELHVFYIVACLSLTWVRFDTVTADTLISSRLLNSSKLYAVATVVVLWSGTTLLLSNASLFSADTYTALLIVDTLNNYQLGLSVKTASIATLLATAYLTTQSFEFFILNIIMLVVIIVLFSMQQTSRKSILTESAANVLSTTALLGTTSTIIRQQNQTRQLSRDPAVRCITNNAGLLVNGVATKSRELRANN